MSPLQRSEALRKEADELMDFLDVHEKCKFIGDVTLSGSYFLDLMIYPDIDIYVPQTTPSEMAKLAEKFFGIESVIRINCLKGRVTDQKPLWDGLYLKPVVEFGNWQEWGIRWKIDIWSLPSEVVKIKQQELNSLKQRMTSSQRKQILEYKYSILTENKRTPICSGIFIYRAVIDEGIEDFSEITEYLRSNGGNV